MNSILHSIKSHDLDKFHMTGRQKCETEKCEPLQSKPQNLMYGENYSLHHFFFYYDQHVSKSIESHDIEKIYVIGRLEMHEKQNLRMNSSSSNHENSFFQCLNDVGGTFSFKIIFTFFVLKKILEGNSFQTHPSSLNLSQLGVDIIE